MNYQREYSMDPLTRSSLDSSLQIRVMIVIPLGCMSSAAIASPILFEYQKYWLITIVVFFVTSGAFVAQYPTEMKTFGPFTSAFATFLGFAAYSSARTPLPQLVPWIPIVVWLFVLLTVYFLPKVQQIISRSFDAQDAMEQGHNHRFQFHMENFRVEPDIRTGQRYASTEVSNLLRGMDCPSVPGLPDGVSTHESDIDLPEPSAAQAVTWQRAVCIGQEGYPISGLSQTSSERPYPGHRAAGVHSGHFQDSDDGFNSISSESVAIYPASTIAGSESPLLE